MTTERRGPGRATGRMQSYLLLLSVVFTVVVVAIHVAPLLLVNPLWRDELSSVNVARLPLREIPGHLQFDSFPALWIALLRVWMELGPGGSDASLRLFGALVGIALLLVLWWARRGRTPLLVLVLVAANPAVVFYGDSLRGYGLGALGSVVVVATCTRALRSPSSLRIGHYALASLLTVHVTYFNPLVVLATAVAAALASLVRGEERLALLFLLAPAPAALSMLIYVPVWASISEWIVILRANVPQPRVVLEAWHALKTGGRTFAMTWAIVIGAVFATTLQAVRRGSLERTKIPEAVFYLSLPVVLAAVHVAFLRTLKHPLHPWMYLTLIAVAGLATDGQASLLPDRKRVILTVVGSAALIATALPRLPAIAAERRTNLDLVARAIERTARRGDYVVVFPWMWGITFDRYFEGPIEWSTVPPIGEYSGHRYDKLKEAMQDPRAMDAIVARVCRVLEAGDRVFWVGMAPEAAASNEPSIALAPPSSADRWAEMPHYRAWARQLVQECLRGVAAIHHVRVEADRDVVSYERAGLWVIQTVPRESS